MVQIQNFLKNTTDIQSDRNFPLLNSLFLERFSMFNPNSPDNNYKTYMKWARRSPQLMGFLDIVATDMLSDGVEFKPMDRSSGRNKIINAFIEGLIVNFAVWGLLGWRFNFITIMAWGFAVKQFLDLYWRLKINGTNTKLPEKHN